MKSSEVTGGAPVTLHVKSTDGRFDPVPDRGREVTLVHSGGQFLLKKNDNIWSIEGVNSSRTIELSNVLSGKPLIAYIAQARPEELVIETRSFPSELCIPEEIQIGLDDKVMDDVRRGHSVSGTATDVARWLEDQLFLPPAPDGPDALQRLVVSGDVSGRLDAFRIYGLKVAADVRRVDRKLCIERVLRGGKRTPSRLTLMYAPVSIVDVTAATSLHGAVRTVLSQAVMKKNSYLSMWKKYHDIENESVLRRARTFGVIRYQRCERQRDGSWRFHLLHPKDDLVDRLGLLGEYRRFEMEADKHEPVFGEDTAPKELALKQPAGRVQRFSAPILDVNVDKQFIDLAGPDEDDEQLEPPDIGVLYLSTSGDRARLVRRERAEEALRQGNCPLPQLGLLMEGEPVPAVRRSDVNLEGQKLKLSLRKVFGDAAPTIRQYEAIEIALNTPDICLIQGPPGTGKTKVITAIEQCLAALADKGVEPSHQILVCAAQHDAVENVAQRTEVFGLPAVKIGRRRRGSDTEVNSVQMFIEERAERLRVNARVPSVFGQLSRARKIAVACALTRSPPTEQASRIRELVRELDELLPPHLRDELVKRAASLERPVGLGEPEETEKRIKAARSIRVDPGPFSDDGPLMARIALHRLHDVLTTDERGFLERCAALECENPPPHWLADGRSLRDALIDRLTPSAPTAASLLDVNTQQLLRKVFDVVVRRLATERAGEEAVLTAYLDDLESDPEGVREALEHYTVVLAATLQQAAGNQMRRVLHIEEGQTTFESVIVDEAARANPLDLFIPLSMAKRRAVLVGDHRQLPHLLEPDVERQLAEEVEQGTVERQTLNAVQASLFERMWVLLRALEQKDGIQRTVTLNAQYRMHPELGKYVSQEFYETHGDGVIESPRPADQFTHDLPGYVKNGVSCVAAWLDVPRDRGKEVRGVSKSRPAEAHRIAKEVRRLIDHDSKLTFGVITFYSAQVDEIGQAMISVGLTERTKSARGWKLADEWSTTYNHEGRKVERLRIGTVDAFQGKEFDVVFLSVTRSNPTCQHDLRRTPRVM